MGKIESQVQKVRDDVFQIVDDVVYEAALEQAAILEAATTPTGDARVASGGQGTAGRHDSGHMIDMISSEIKTEGNTIIGTWGWDDYEAYFEAQDEGTARIEAAHSLQGSYIAAREKTKVRVHALMGGF
jgi:hypothetical protein